jgi:hypothetical protein
MSSVVLVRPMSSVVLVSPPHQVPFTHPHRVSSIAFIVNLHLLRAPPARPGSTQAALLASAPFALVRADARPPALLAFVPSALVWADARPSALLAFAPSALVRADARPPALLAFAPFALVQADDRAPALLAFAPFALVRADDRAPVHSMHSLLLRWCGQKMCGFRFAAPPRRVGLSAHPPLAGIAASWLCRRSAAAAAHGCASVLCYLHTSGAHQLLTV